MAGQENYMKAIRQFGQEFADAVISYELQFHADKLECFDKYETYDFMKEFIKPKGGKENG